MTFTNVILHCDCLVIKSSPTKRMEMGPGTRQSFPPFVWNKDNIYNNHNSDLF